MLYEQREVGEADTTIRKSAGQQSNMFECHTNLILELG